MHVCLSKNNGYLVDTATVKRVFMGALQWCGPKACRKTSAGYRAAELRRPCLRGTGHLMRRPCAGYRALFNAPALLGPSEHCAGYRAFVMRRPCDARASQCSRCGHGGDTGYRPCVRCGRGAFRPCGVLRCSAHCRGVFPPFAFIDRLSPPSSKKIKHYNFHMMVGWVGAPA